MMGAARLTSPSSPSIIYSRMSGILRWFYDGDVRHRIYFRTVPERGERELVLAGPEVEVSLPASLERLEDYSEEELVRLARRARGLPETG